MRTTILAIALLLCNVRPASAKLRVVTSIETFADLIRKIGGDRVDVTSLGRGFMDPHFVEPKPNLMLALNRADLLIHVGLELEIGWLPPLVLGARNPKIQVGATGNLDASSVIPVLDVAMTKMDRSMGDIHPMGNPHYWIPPDNARILAREFTDRLRTLDPDGAATFDRNLQLFDAELQKRKSAWEAKAAPLKGLNVITYHKSWSYVSKWLGLVEAGYLEPKPGIPPSPSHVATLIGTMRRDKVKVLIMESFFPRNTADLVAQKAGAKVVVLPSDVGASPQTKDYFSLVDTAIDKLVEAVR